MKESLVAAEVNCTSQGTPSLACMTECTLMPPFFFPVLGCRPTPLKKASELLCHISDGYYPCYGGNGIRGYISRKSHHGLYNIIGRQGALCGNVTLANSDFYATEHAVVVTPLIATSPYWLYYLLTALNLNQYAKGVAQPGLSVGVINEISIPVPPLELQEKFAARIEQIEAQKKVLENTIAELQTLLDSRMDYWFN